MIATNTLVVLLFIELVLNRSGVKQMFCQPIHLTHELILCKQMKMFRYLSSFLAKRHHI